MIHQETVMVRWNQLRAAVEQAAKRAETHPDEARSHGLTPIPPRDPREPEGALAPWLRAAAHALIPPCFEWELVHVMGGDVFLILKGYRDDLSQTAPAHSSAAPPFGPRTDGYPRNLD